MEEIVVGHLLKPRSRKVVFYTKSNWRQIVYRLQEQGYKEKEREEEWQRILKSVTFRDVVNMYDQLMSNKMEKLPKQTSLSLWQITKIIYGAYKIF